HVRVFESQHQHRVLTVDATTLVEVDDSRRPRAQLSTSWSDMATAWVADRFAEYLTPTPSSAPEPDLQLVASGFAAAHSPHETALSLATYIYDQMTYQPGSTGVSTSAAQAWRARRGVCQDYAHLSSAHCARSASRPGTCRATCTRPRIRNSANRWSARVMRGSSGGSASGRGTIRPTTLRLGSGM